MDAYRIEIGYTTCDTKVAKNFHVIASSIEAAIQAGEECLIDEYKYPSDRAQMKVISATRVLRIDRVAP